MEFLKTLQLETVHSGVSAGTNWPAADGPDFESFSPVDGSRIGTLTAPSRRNYDEVIQVATLAFKEWRSWPAPQRGQVVRAFAEELRKFKEPLGRLVSWEMGKSLQEGMGEVQEMIDICEFAAGLSRQLYGLTIQSERRNHRMFEQYHPLGLVGIITSFNFPVSVWSWNAAIAWVCGDVCIWKPSEKTSFCAVACQQIAARVFAAHHVPEGVSNLVTGSAETGDWIAGDPRIALVSATGSTRMGKVVAAKVAARLGKSILELGGNNAVIISNSADLDLAVTACVFGAIGTAGQRCTTTRRLIIHEEIYDMMKQRLVKAYSQIRIGSPLDEKNHMGPLIDREAVRIYLEAIARCRAEGGHFLVEGGRLTGDGYESGCYVRPCIAEVQPGTPIVSVETFAPILYLMKYRNLDEALEIHNQVPQGLSSSIMTMNVRESERFLSFAGSDCGIANVNIGTSGAEIGGAFGGEKETGGGRESGSDAWKSYMRRQTNTINYSADLPLAQGIRFNL